MLYVAHNMDGSKGYEPALYIVAASEAERRILGDELTMSALGAIAQGSISPEEAYELAKIASGDGLAMEVPAELLHTIYPVLDSQRYAENVELRAKHMFVKAAAGEITVRQLGDELAVAHRYPDSTPSGQWVTGDGHEAYYWDQQVAQYGVKPISSLPEVETDATVQSLAADPDLNLTHYEPSAELIFYPDTVGKPVLVSDRSPIQLGVIDADNKFDPLVTVLDPSHPAVTKPQQ